MQTISAIILTKNEEKMLGGCLRSLDWVDAVIVVDSGSRDQSVAIARKYRAEVLQHTFSSFADARNAGAKAAKTDWIFYVDADERVSAELKQEVLRLTQNDKRYSAFRMPRKNILLGKWLRHGGWYPDEQIRLIRRSALKTWVGDIHETPEVHGEIGKLAGHLLHLTHRSIRAGLIKSADWSGIEARIRQKNGHPPVKKLGILRMSVGEFVRRYVLLHGWKDGMEGFLEAMVQAFNQFLIYARLWELQRKETLEETYNRLEK